MRPICLRSSCTTLNLSFPYTCQNALNIVVLPASAASPGNSFHTRSILGVKDISPQVAFTSFHSHHRPIPSVSGPLYSGKDTDHSLFLCRSRFCILIQGHPSASHNPVISPRLANLSLRSGSLGLCCQFYLNKSTLTTLQSPGNPLIAKHNANIPARAKAILPNFP